MNRTGTDGESAEQRDAAVRRRDRVALLAVVAVFLGVNLATASRIPYPWMDEIVFADVATNFATGRGFTSTSWHNSASDQILAVNAPLYGVLLGGWLSLIGTGQVAARSAALFLTAGAVVLIWEACRKLQIVASTSGRVWVAALVICDYGYAFSYKSGRPDCLGVFLAALMLYSLTWGGLWRYGTLAICGYLIPFAGLQTAAFTMLFGFVVLLVFYRRLRGEVLTVICATLLGLVSFYLTYSALGIWGNFAKELQFQGSTNIFDRIVQRLTTSPLQIHRHTIPKDFTLPFLYAAVAVTSVWLIRRRALISSSTAVFGLLVAVLVPAGMYLGLAFSTYYSWMVCIPLAITYNALWSRLDFGRLRSSIFALQAAACLVGLPLQLALFSFDWAERDPRALRDFVTAAVRPDDVVYCAWPAYYEAKSVAKEVYLPMYLRAIRPAEAAAVTVAIVSPYGTPGLSLTTDQQLAALGGSWTKTGETMRPRRGGPFGNNWQFGYLSLPNYEFEVYRRTAGS